MVDGQQLIGDLPQRYEEVVTMTRKIQNTLDHIKRLLTKLKILSIVTLMVINSGMIVVDFLSDVESELVKQWRLISSIDQHLLVH